MRVLFALTIVFALLWAGTGAATSEERAEYSTGIVGISEGLPNEPDDSFITLVSIYYAAYGLGIACLAIMGAGLIVRANRRMDDSPPETE